jgi:hypothetical protein
MEAIMMIDEITEVSFTKEFNVEVGVYCAACCELMTFSVDVDTDQDLVIMVAKHKCVKEKS